VNSPRLWSEDATLKDGRRAINISDEESEGVYMEGKNSLILSRRAGEEQRSEKRRLVIERRSLVHIPTESGSKEKTCRESRQKRRDTGCYKQDEIKECKKISRTIDRSRPATFARRSSDLEGP